MIPPKSAPAGTVKAAPASAEELKQFETDALSGCVLARASAGLADGTIRGDVGHLDQIRSWFGRPLWDMEPADADAYFGKVLRGSPSGTRLARSQALTTYFMFLELRHKVELHRMTGRVIECPIDEMNRPRGTKDAQLRIPPSEPEVGTLFAGWGGELATCQEATLERLRVDRQLEEAMAQGPDPLHLAEVFGLHEKTAMRYAESARALLEQAAETDP